MLQVKNNAFLLKNMKQSEIKALGAQLRAERTRRNLTQTEMAQELGIGFSTLQALEIGVSKAVGKRVRGIVETFLREGKVAPKEVHDQKEEVERFGAWLEEARTRRGMTIEELASATKVSRSTIINLEKKRANGINATTRQVLESFFIDDVAVCALKSMSNNGLEHLRDTFGKIADIVLSKDFSPRVDGVSKMLRVPRRDAAIYIFEVDLRK